MQFIEEIITFAKANGNKISYEELSLIFDSHNMGEINDSELEVVMGKLTSENIEFVEEKEESVDALLSDIPTDDSIRLYLRDISTYSLLTAEEEIELGKKIANGDKSAEKELVEHNLKLVVSIAKKYYRMYEKRVELLELIEFGNIGLMAAAEKFDVNKKCKFSTYATWWIRQKITRGVAEEADLIRKPVHINGTIQAITRFRRQFCQQNGRFPTKEETMDALNIPESTYELAFKGYTTSSVVSLNEPVGEEKDGDTELGEFIPDPSKSPEEEYEEKNLRETIRKILDVYYERRVGKCKRNHSDSRTTEETVIDSEKRNVNIIKYRFGLPVDDPVPEGLEEFALLNANGEPLTLDAIGQIYDITRERVRQIVEKGLKSLKPIAKELGLTKEQKARPKKTHPVVAETESNIEKLKSHESSIDIKELRERRLYFDVCSGREKKYYDNTTHRTEVPGQYTKMELLKVMGYYDLLIILNATKGMNEKDSLMYIFDFNYRELKNIYGLLERFEFALSCAKDDAEKEKKQSEILALREKKREFRDALKYLEKRIKSLSKETQEEFAAKYGKDYMRTLRKEN